MSTLGEVLARLEDPQEVFALLVEAGDIKAVATLNDMANASGQDACELALDAVHAFTEQASDEAWVKLIGRVQGAESPGSACLSEMITWSLAR